MIPNPGDRVRVTGIMPNDPAPMEVGAEGTVEDIGSSDLVFGHEAVQIFVKWDNGRGLILLSTDPFEVVE